MVRARAQISYNPAQQFLFAKTQETRRCINAFYSLHLSHVL
jgi:hypothetical protein